MNDPYLYIQHNSSQQIIVTEILKKFADKLSWNENERVLDVGSATGDGTAHLILPLLKPSSKLVGCDISKLMIEYSRKHFQIKNLTFEVVDIVSDDASNILGKETFDKVLSFYCLQWVVDHRLAFTNIWRVLKPNGTAILSFALDDTMGKLLNIVQNMQEWKTYSTDLEKYVQEFPNNEAGTTMTINLLESVGFKVIEYSVIHRDIYMESIQDLGRFIKSLNPFIERIPSERSKEYDDLFIKLVIDKGFAKAGENGTYRIPHSVLSIHCQKV